MQSLVLPRPTSFLPTSFGHPPEAEDGLAKFRSKFSPGRPEQHSYPSPPMSEPHSPTRRSAQTSDPSRPSYHGPVNQPHRSEASLPLPTPTSSLYGPRSALPAHGVSQQRQLYPGEPQPRGQSMHYAPGRAVQHSQYENAQVPQNLRWRTPCRAYGSASDHDRTTAPETHQTSKTNEGPRGFCVRQLQEGAP
jgi:hypothetical protein